jgi:hypothetical protein
MCVADMWDRIVRIAFLPARTQMDLAGALVSRELWALVWICPRSCWDMISCDYMYLRASPCPIKPKPSRKPHSECRSERSSSRYSGFWGQSGICMSLCGGFACPQFVERSFKPMGISHRGSTAAANLGLAWLRALNSNKNPSPVLAIFRSAHGCLWVGRSVPVLPTSSEGRHRGRWSASWAGCEASMGKKAKDRWILDEGQRFDYQDNVTVEKLSRRM